MKSVFVGVSCQQSNQVLMTFVVKSFQAKHLIVYLFLMRSIVSFLHLKLFDSKEKIIMGCLNISISFYDVMILNW